MTDNEIVKALKICSTIGASCKDCPAFVKDNRSTCKEVLLGAITLIDRQNSEIERLQKEVNLVSIQFQDLQERYEEAQAEIDRLNEVYQANQQLINALNKSYFLAKSEAVKEFVERLKAIASQGFWESDAYIGVEQIDDLLKEIIEENK